MVSFSKVVDMRGGGRNRRARSTSGDSASSGQSRSSRRDGNDRPRTGSVSASDQDDAPIPRRAVVDADGHSCIGVGVSRYASVGYRGLAGAS